MSSLTLLLEACLVLTKFEFCLFDIIIFREFVLNIELGDFKGLSKNVCLLNQSYLAARRKTHSIKSAHRVILENLKKILLFSSTILSLLNVIEHGKLTT